MRPRRDHVGHRDADPPLACSLLVDGLDAISWALLASAESPAKRARCWPRCGPPKTAPPSGPGDRRRVGRGRSETVSTSTLVGDLAVEVDLDEGIVRACLGTLARHGLPRDARGPFLTEAYVLTTLGRAMIAVIRAGRSGPERRSRPRASYQIQELPGRSTSTTTVHGSSPAA